MGTQLPHLQRAQHPNFRPISAVAKWLDGLRCNLVWRYGLGSGDVVLDEDPAPPPEKGGRAPNFRPMSIVAKRLNRMTLGMEVDLGPSDIVLNGNPAPRKRGHNSNFRSMSIVAKRLDASNYLLVPR